MAQTKEKIYAFDLEEILNGNACICGTYTIKSNDFPTNLKILTAIMDKEVEELHCIFSRSLQYRIEYGTLTNLPYLVIAYPGGTCISFRICNIRKI